MRGWNETFQLCLSKFSSSTFLVQNNEIAFCVANVNYLINCAKSCYESFDNDNKIA